MSTTQKNPAFKQSCWSNVLFSFSCRDYVPSSFLQVPPRGTMPPKRPIKPALQQPQQIQQADQQSQQNNLPSHSEHNTSVPMQYGQPHGGGNVGGINVGFHQPHHPHHQHHQIHSGVLGGDNQLVMDPSSGNTGKLLQQKPVDQRIVEQGEPANPAPGQPPTRKRSRVSKAAAVAAAAASSSSSGAPVGGNGGAEASGTEAVTSPPNKKSRTNTPWTPQEEQRLKAMRDAGNSWSEIAKTFPTRTEGSVKKHWYKVPWAIIAFFFPHCYCRFT